MGLICCRLKKQLFENLHFFSKCSLESPKWNLMATVAHTKMCESGYINISCRIDKFRSISLKSINTKHHYFNYSENRNVCVETFFKSEMHPYLDFFVIFGFSISVKRPVTMIELWQMYYFSAQLFYTFFFSLIASPLKFFKNAIKPQYFKFFGAFPTTFCFA